MKRIISAALVVLFLLFLLPKQRSFAREEVKVDLGSLKWQMLKEGASKTDLGPGLPEVAILKVSNEEFEKIHASKAAALKFLDNQHIFKRKLIKVVFCVVTRNHSDGWLLIIPHTPDSTACIIAWQIP
jgi:hypothetical protein